MEINGNPTPATNSIVRIECGTGRHLGEVLIIIRCDRGFHKLAMGPDVARSFGDSLAKVADEVEEKIENSGVV